MGRFLYFLVVLLLARTAIRYAIAWIQAGARQQVRGGGHSASMQPIHKGNMVRDPICGIHLPESRALSELRSGDQFFFCSEECRRAFLKG